MFKYPIEILLILKLKAKKYCLTKCYTTAVNIYLLKTLFFKQCFYQWAQVKVFKFNKWHLFNFHIYNQNSGHFICFIKNYNNIYQDSKYSLRDSIFCSALSLILTTKF